MPRARASILAALALTVAATPASAQGWRWLEKLSGPGDFYGLEYNQKIWCAYDTLAARGQELIGVSLPCLKRVAKDKADQETRDFEHRIYAAGLGVGYMRAMTNNLSYAPTDDHVDRTVQIITLEAFFDHRICKDKRVDVGAAIGVNRFLVPSADDFTRISIEPRVTFKLFDLRQGDAFKGTFGVRVGVLIFTKGFKDTDFGAIPGTYESGKEIGPSIRFVFDFDRNPLTSGASNR